MHLTEGMYNDGGQFTDGPPATTIPAEWLNAVQNEIANVIEQAGLALRTSDTDSMDQLWQAIRPLQRYDIVVNNQTLFESLFERNAANDYQIKGDYKSIFVKQIPGGSYYNVARILSGGDTWGDIKTNQCTLLKFEPGAKWNFGALAGHLEVNTDDADLDNVEITGTGVAGAIVDSFLLNAYRVTFSKCKASNRNSNVDMVGFQGSGVALHNITSKYRDCVAYTLDGSGNVYGFESCMNFSNCVAYDLDSSGDSARGFSNCNQVSVCVAYDIEGNDNTVGFYSCSQINSCWAEKIDNNALNNAAGFWGCNQISGCYANDIDALNGAGGNALGFTDCDQISACRADDIDSIAGQANGFANCNYGSALYTAEAANAGNTFMCSLDAQIVNKESTPQVWT